MIEILISSTVLILIICGIRTFWKGKINLHLQYALWLLVVIRLLPFGLFTDMTIPKLESPVSIMRSFDYLSEALLNSDTSAITPNATRTNEAAGSNQADQTAGNAEQSANAISNTTNNSTPANSSSQPTDNSSDVKLNLTLLKTIAVIAWYIGMLLGTLWFLYVNIRFHHLIKKDRKLLNEVSCKLPVYVSSGIHSPMLLMINGRFGIYVTQACADDNTKMNHALAHELCHYKHLDYLWSLVRCILLITYWFHPLVWLAAAMSKRDCELSCDTAALKILGDEERFSYGRTILEFVAVHNSPGNLLNIATGMSESKSGIKERIQRITQKSKMMFGTRIAISVIVAAAIITTFTAAPQKAEVLSDSKEANQETNTVMKEYSSSATETEDTDLQNLLDDEAPAKGLDTGYYFNGEQFITPDGPIESLSDFTDDMIINKYYGRNVWGETDSALKDGFSKSFRKLEGVSYWLTIDTAEETSITIDYTTTATDTTLKTLVVLPDETIVELKNGADNTITLPKGEAEIVMIALDAGGEVNLRFDNLADGVSVQKTK